MGSIGKNSGTVTPIKDSSGSRLKMRHFENTNPNVNDSISPVPKLSKSSPSIKSAKVGQKSVSKNPSTVSNSPKYKIRERKFVVAKKNLKKEKSGKSKTDCKLEVKIGCDAKKSLCMAYETLRASQEEFFKNQSGGIGEIDELEEEIERKLMIQDLQIEAANHGVNGESESNEQASGSTIKRQRERLMETARNSIAETGSGKVKHLVMAFEKLKTMQISKETDENEEIQLENQENSMEEKSKVMKWALPGLPPPMVPERQASSSLFCPSELILTSESLGLDPRASVSSSWDGSRGSISSRTSHGGTRSRRNSTESAVTIGGSRWKKKQLKVTKQKPFKLRTEERGKEKEEEFMKRVQETMIEEERQRVPIALGLPWTTDEPQCLVKPNVKENTRPVDLVLNSDVRAVERAEFDHQVSEKLTMIEQYKMEREKQQKMAEEEELRRLRKELVPKAQPMPHFDRPFIPRRGQKSFQLYPKNQSSISSSPPPTAEERSSPAFPEMKKARVERNNFLLN